ncbi:hypothetical protein FB45DRAFT_1036318 [Roridomyces roridus]|uniref:Uncharacterized protein n=1 Tax=Roridomyces roridus TaxID=1738132 RepID=A0AAD7B8G3_9AGAR|nr:hypothetical protein FB45DRAFT_1036318 [Roridomyces roridus]
MAGTGFSSRVTVRVFLQIPVKITTTAKRQSGCKGGGVFLYGIYVVLFGFYLKILRKPGEFRKNRSLHSATIALFLLSTIHLALLLAMTVQEARQLLGLTYDVHGAGVTSTATFGIYVTSNVIADSIFVFRCYAIWSFRRRIVAVPALCTLLVAGFGYWQVAQPDDIASAQTGITSFNIPILISLAAATTILLMILSAGRIWGLARSARQIMGYKTVGWYYTVCAMILESGALYAAGAVLLVTLSKWEHQYQCHWMISNFPGQRSRGQLSSIDFHISTTEPVQQPGASRPESITEVQKIETV